MPGASATRHLRRNTRSAVQDVTCRGDIDGIRRWFIPAPAGPPPQLGDGPDPRGAAGPEAGPAKAVREKRPFHRAAQVAPNNVGGFLTIPSWW